MASLESRWLKLAAFGISGVAAYGIGGPAASARAALPRVPTSLYTDAHDLAIRPRYILVSQDANVSLWGPQAREFKGTSHWPHEPHIRWLRWTSKRAVATGSLIQGNCSPSCFRGTFITYPVRMRLSRPARFHGERIFTRLSYTLLAKRPPDHPRTVVAIATYIPATRSYGGAPAYWGWQPTL